MRIVWKRWFHGACSITIGFCLLAACKVERPETVLSNEHMEAILLDFHLAKAMGEELPHNERYKQTLYREAVFQKYNITEAEFDSSMVWYARHPEVIAGIYENIRERLRTQRDFLSNLIAERDNKPKVSLPGDSINVWMWQNIYQLSGTPLNNKLTFTLTPDTNFHDRDTLCWNVRFRFQGNSRPDSANAPIMAMQIRYKSDSIVTDVRQILTDTLGTIALTADTLGKMERINGFIYYPSQPVARLLVLDHISLMRYHATDSLNVDTVSNPSPHLQLDTQQETKQLSANKDTVRQVPPNPVGKQKKIKTSRPLKQIDKPLHISQQQQ